MDSARAKRMVEELVGTEVGGWCLEKFVGAGKSALVLDGSKGGVNGAVKIFDPELVDRFGRDAQLERVMRELELKGHDFPHLIKIFDGGECKDTGYLYVVMELHDWPSLSEVIDEVPRDKIWQLLGSVSGAAQYLEGRNLVHRDIKPSNIIVNPDFTETRLLDLGVIRPVGNSDLTDDKQRPFIGTLRYSSPEFLRREEEDTVEGWRAVTFYQIGGVLHDIIMRKPLFEEFAEPYARMVHAVATEVPCVEDSGTDPDLILLARNCLTKDPGLRTRLVSWDSFIQQPDDTSHAVKLKHRLSQRRMAAASLTDSDDDARTARQARAELIAVSHILEEVEELVRQIPVSSEFLPPGKFSVSQNPGDNLGHFVTRFEPSRRYALEIGFSIYIEVCVVHAPEKVVGIRYCAATDAQITVDRLHEGDSSNAYEGVFERKVLHDKLYMLFHGVLDQVQQLPSPHDESKGIVWVKLTEFMS